jgi:predicted dehydrogenase
LREIAKETGVVTQMGQQGHATEGSRKAVEVLRSGGIGEVREVHVWTDRPAGWWPQGVERPADTPPVPPGLDWDLWLGPAPHRPYHPDYVPFKWRGRYDFGTGSIGDMGVHNLDVAYWGLELGLPTSAALRDSDQRPKDSPPLWSIIDLEFPARAQWPPVKVTFYDGQKLPPKDLFHGEEQPTNGSLIIGSRGTLFTRTWHGGVTPDDMFLLLPHQQYTHYSPPPPSLPRTPEHHAEWIAACKGGPPTQSNFDYASRLTESLLVGLLAVRLGRRIDWEADAMKAKSCPEADPFIKPQLRQGWEL